MIKSLYFVRNIHINPRIPIPFKNIIINSYIICKVLISLLYNLEQITQKLVNKNLLWVASMQNIKSFTPIYSFIKNFNFPSLSSKYALAQVKYLNKWKNSICIISCLVNDILKSRKYP